MDLIKDSDYRTLDGKILLLEKGNQGHANVNNDVKIEETTKNIVLFAASAPMSDFMQHQADFRRKKIFKK